MKPVYRLKFAHPDMHGLQLDVTAGSAEEATKEFVELAVEVGKFASQLAELTGASKAEAEELDLPVEPLPAS